MQHCGNRHAQARPGGAPAAMRCASLPGRDVEHCGHMMSVSIRTRLLLLVLATLLPALAGFGYFIHSSLEWQRSTHERLLRDTTRALSSLVDLELRQRTTIAWVLAGSRWLDSAPDIAPAELGYFEQLGRRALQGLDGWLELRGPDGLLLDTRHGHGSTRAGAAPKAVGAPIALADLRAIEPLSAAASGDEAHAAALEPVQRGGRTLLNVAVTIRPQELQRIVDAQVLPAGWVSSVLDSQARVVASHPGGAALLGVEATPELQALLATRREGLFETTSVHGQRSIGYFRTTAQGWSYVATMPHAQFQRLTTASLLPIGAGTVGLMLLALAGALLVSRRIARPVRELESAAIQLHAGRSVDYRSTGIAECDAVAAALSSASETLRRNRNRLEMEVADAVRRTRDAEQRLSRNQRIEALGRLTGGVAHDFNNLLGTISNSTHLIERHPAAADLQLPLTGIRRAVDAGSRLTQHLQRFAGRHEAQPSAVDLASYLPETQALLRSVLGERIAVSTDVAPGTAAVCVDAGELELALINLALNARDAMPSGGTLQLQARDARERESEGLAGRPRQRYVVIAVADDGAGLTDEVAAHAFDPFYTTKPVGKGSGLGLSQVMGFCVQAGGTARVDSRPGRGTTVSLLLPAVAADEAAPEPAAAAPSVAQRAALVGLQVLLVEDNEELAQLTAAVLEMNDMKVTQVPDATQALQRLVPPHGIHIVMSDVIVPGEIDGLMLAQRLRREQPALPVLVVSGYSGTPAPVQDFVLLRKPYSEDALLAALWRALQQRH